LIYLDNAATSFPKAPGVAEAVAASIRELPGSAGRSSHPGAREAARLLFELRAAATAFLGLSHPEGLVFTKNATEALNIVLFGSLPPGGRVLVSSLEHNAVMRPLGRLKAASGLKVDIFGLDAEGRPQARELEGLLALGPDLLVVTGASNVSGALPPLGEIIASAHARAVPVLVDASQLAGHGRVDFGSLDPDYLAMPGHKGLLGPAGTGLLWVAPGRTAEALILGGTGSASESEDMPAFLPDRLEAGTHNLASLAGLAASLAWLEAQGLDTIAQRESRLTLALLEGLEGLPGLRVLGPQAGRPRAALVSVASAGLALDELCLALDRAGIAARMGLHCAPLAHRSLGSLAGGGALRLSPGPFTTETDISTTLAVLEEALR
jgi:cysteine desulfurase family protein